LTVWVTLLRGVNVGGNKKLLMAEFRAMLGGLGYTKVATYIQSGNAVFQSDDTPAQISDDITAAITETFGFHADVFVMPVEKLRHAIAANPFGQAQDVPKSLHLIFLQTGDQTLDHDQMAQYLKPGQAYHLDGDVMYLYAPDGISSCPLATKLDRFVTGSMSARNLRSAQMIAELAARERP
jgi:uncharacterized protein (DUF1697 family)